MLQAIYDAAVSGFYTEQCPLTCGCRGSGWYLSGVDTWHACPVHHRKGQRHPEYDYDDDDDDDDDEPVVSTPAPNDDDDDDNVPF